MSNMKGNFFLTYLKNRNLTLGYYQIKWLQLCGKAILVNTQQVLRHLQIYLMLSQPRRVNFAMSSYVLCLSLSICKALPFLSLYNYENYSQINSECFWHTDKSIGINISQDSYSLVFFYKQYLNTCNGCNVILDTKDYCKKNSLQKKMCGVDASLIIWYLSSHFSRYSLLLFAPPLPRRSVPLPFLVSAACQVTSWILCMLLGGWKGNISYYQTTRHIAQQNLSVMGASKH